MLNKVLWHRSAAHGFHLTCGDVNQTPHLRTADLQSVKFSYYMIVFLVQNPGLLSQVTCSGPQLRK